MLLDEQLFLNLNFRYYQLLFLLLRGQGHMEESLNFIFYFQQDFLQLLSYHCLCLCRNSDLNENQSSESLIKYIQFSNLNLQMRESSGLYKKMESRKISSPNSRIEAPLKHLKQLDISSFEKPKSLIIMHYNNKRISVPLFKQERNLGQLLYHHIYKFEQAVLNNQPSWQKKSKSKIVCFQIKKQSKIQKNEELQNCSNGDLQSDIVLSLFRIQDNKDHQFMEQLQVNSDITKIFKYLEVEPYIYHFQNQQIKYPNFSTKLILPFYNFYRILTTSTICNIYLVRNVSNGYFFTIKVYKENSACGFNEKTSIDLIHSSNQNSGDNSKQTLLSFPKQVFYIPYPDSEDSEGQENQSTCKHIAVINPFYINGTLEELLKRIKQERQKKIDEMDCLQFLKQLIWGVHVLHEKYNLIHRAIVPSNIMVDQQNRLKIVNFSSCIKCFDERGKIINYFSSSSRVKSHFEQQQNPSIEQIFEKGQVYYDIGQYTPPQVRKKEQYNYLTDFYCVGLIIKQIYESIVQISKEESNSKMYETIEKLTSPDLIARSEFVDLLIQSISRQYFAFSEKNIKNAAISLKQINVGSPIVLQQNRKFIENQDIFNGIDHSDVISFFKKRKQPKQKQGSRVTKNKSKEKNSTNNSRSKEKKCKSKTSQQGSLTKPRKLSKNNRESNNNSFNFKKQNSSVFSMTAKKSNENVIEQKRTKISQQGSNKKKSKSKSQQKIKNSENQHVKLYTYQDEKQVKNSKKHFIVENHGAPKNPPTRLKSPKSRLY